MVTKNFLNNAAACRELFFSEDLPAADLERFQGLLRDNASKIPVIDVSGFSMHSRRADSVA
jgi:hypothetical protein